MVKVEICTGTSYGDANLVVGIIRGTKLECKVARFKPITGSLNLYDSTTWPLVLECSSEERGLESFELRVLFWTPGDGLELEENLQKVLNEAGFKVDTFDFSQPKVLIRE